MSTAYEYFEVGVDRPDDFVNSEGQTEVSFAFGAVTALIGRGSVKFRDFAGDLVELNEFEFADLVDIWQSKRPSEPVDLSGGLVSVEWRQTAIPEYGGGVIQDWTLWEDDERGDRVPYDDAHDFIKELMAEDVLHLHSTQVEYRIVAAK